MTDLKNKSHSPGGCGCSKDNETSGLDKRSNYNGDYENLSFINSTDTDSGKIQIVSHRLNFSDYLGNLKVRLNISRDNYKIKPGLYGIGMPDSKSPVLVTANYKLSFDSLRKELPGVSAWILVLDTKGINVWCAAGKGTFGTEGLIREINETGLHRVVEHRKLILPQLCAPGVSAHDVSAETGFKMIYGPIRSSDIVEFLENNMRVSEEMRLVRFNLYDRLVLIPIELSLALKYFLMIAVVLLIISGFGNSGFSMDEVLKQGLKSIMLLLAAFLSGAAMTPLLLPYIPGRAFAFKGFITGVVLFSMFYFFYPSILGNGMLKALAWLMVFSSISSYLAMNFTGSSTYTSLSGVKKEMRIAVPIQAMGAVSALTMFIIEIFQ